MAKVLDKGNSYPFLAMVTWEHTEDKEMIEKLFKAYRQNPEKKTSKNDKSIPWESINAFYLTGERILVLVGHAKTPLDIQKISSFFILNSSIQIKIYHVLDAASLPMVINNPAVETNS